MNKNNLIAKILEDTGCEPLSLADYTFEVKEAYVSMLASLAWSDGCVDDRELSIIESIAEESGPIIKARLQEIVNNTQKYDIDNFDRWVTKITDRPVKISLMADMFLTAFADTICQQSESIYMKYIAGKLGVDMDTYEIIRNNVEQFLVDTSGNKNAVSYEPQNPDTTPEPCDGKNMLSRVVSSFLKTFF